MTGAPQIVPDHSACREIFSDCGVLVPVITNVTFDNSMTVGGLISPEGLAEAMNKLYSDKELYNRLAEATVKKFSTPMYDWKVISGQWSDLFKEALAT